jgi:hypothetical protein
MHNRSAPLARSRQSLDWSVAFFINTLPRKLYFVPIKFVYIQLRERERERRCVCVCVCVYVFERERERLCARVRVSKRERERLCVRLYVCVRTRARVCVSKRGRLCVCVCVCVSVYERKEEWTELNSWKIAPSALECCFPDGCQF